MCTIVLVIVNKGVKYGIPVVKKLAELDNLFSAVKKKLKIVFLRFN